MVQRQGRCVLRAARRSIESDMQAVVDRIYFIPCAISVKENNAEGVPRWSPATLNSTLHSEVSYCMVCSSVCGNMID